MKTKTLPKNILASYVKAVLIAGGVLLTMPAGAQDLSASPPTPPSFSTNEWGAVTNGFQLGLRVPKVEYESGEKILVFVVLRNLTDKPVAFRATDPYRDYEVTITRSDGLGVSYSDWWISVKDLPPSPFMLGVEPVPAHQQQPHPALLDATRLYKMNRPGTYIVTAKQHVDLVERISREPLVLKPISRFDILSNPVTITVVPKPEK